MKTLKQLTKSGQWFSVDFIKKDGSVRSMTARLGVKRHLKRPEDAPKRPSNPALAVVWDRHADGSGAYRSFKLASVLSLRHGGQTYYPVKLDGETFFSTNDLTNLI